MIPITAIISMLCVTTLAAIGMANNIDGALYWTALTIIGGLGGFAIGTKKRKNDASTHKDDKTAT